MKRTFYTTRGRYFADLTAIQILDYDHETEKFWIIERDGKPPIRISKDEQRHCYFDSWEDAWANLKQMAEQSIKAYQDAVLRSKREYGQIRKMTKPNYRPVGER